jgi:glycosyltransferase involved in cell wall biosynthesis
VAPMSLKRGRPVIATPVGGLPEQIRHGETGLLTESVSPQAIAAAIKRLAEDRDFLHRLAANARRHAEEDIGWRTLGPRFSDVLERVAR